MTLQIGPVMKSARHKVRDSAPRNRRPSLPVRQGASNIERMSERTATGGTPLTNLRLALPVRNAVDAHAEDIGSDRSAVIREAIAEYLDSRGIEVAAS